MTDPPAVTDRSECGRPNRPRDAATLRSAPVEGPQPPPAPGGLTDLVAETRETAAQLAVVLEEGVRTLDRILGRWNG